MIDESDYDAKFKATIAQMSKTHSKKDVNSFMLNEVNSHMREKIAEMKPKLVDELQKMKLADPVEMQIKEKIIKSLKDGILPQADIQQSQDEEIDLSGMIYDKIYQDVD